MRPFLLVIILLAFFPSITLATAVLPNDPFYLKNQASYLGQARIPEAWSETTGSDDVVIAIIDSGVDMDHPDIIGNMWFNRNEIPLNGIDDDNNGFVDDLNGWDFLANTSDPHPKFDGDYTFEGISHGTVVAGIAAADTNNNEGLAGVCWKCKIMALRAVSGDGTGNTDDVAKAIQYAVDNGADIINMSFVGHLMDEILTNALQKAYEAGIVLVAAVGNEADDDSIIGGDLDFRPVYPVCSDGNGNQILGVGSVNKNNQKSTFSNYGFHCIDINAPGNGLAGPQLYDPLRGDRYSEKYRAGWRGTSMSTPVVSGVIGLIKAMNPRLTNDQIISIVRRTGHDISQENPFYIAQLGGGLLDAEAAVKLAGETSGLGFEKKKAPGKLIKQTIIVTPLSNHRPEVIELDQSGQEQNRWLVWPESFKSGVAATIGDIDGDGQRDIVVLPTRGGPQVRIFSLPSGELKKQFFAYDKKYRSSMALVLFDINGDGRDEILTAMLADKENYLKVFNGDGLLLSTITLKGIRWLGTPSLAVADLDADGDIEIIVGQGRGTLPQVEIFDKLGNKEASWLAYAKSFRGGVRVAVGDVDGDEVPEVLTSPIQGGPQIRIFNSRGAVKGQFFAFERDFRGGVTLAVGNIDTDPAAEIIIGAGAGRESEIRVFSKYGADFSQDSFFTVFEKNFKGGVNLSI